MKKNNIYFYYLLIFIIFIIFIIISLFVYGNYSGSCYNKNYLPKECNKNFCLIKKFIPDLPQNYKNILLNITNNNNFKKRVEIMKDLKYNNLNDCAIPSKSGSTIGTKIILREFPEFINYYQNQLCKKISNIINIKLKHTPLKYNTSCCILIYEKEGDWINWHYDYNYYNGRFFTVLIPLTNKLTCTKFQYRINNNIEKINLVDEAIIFEGDFLYHNASKICKNEKRIILSLQYCTDDTISELNKYRIKIKDIAFDGLI